MAKQKGRYTRRGVRFASEAIHMVCRTSKTATQRSRSDFLRRHQEFVMTEGQARFGLKETTIAVINAIFARYPVIDRAVLYGSRAKGTFRPGSDIDLTLIGAVTYQELQRIEAEIDDLLLPYTVDLSLHRQIDNPDLLAHIERVGIVFYRKEEKQ